MAVYLDTGVIVAARNNRDRNHATGVRLLREAMEGSHGVAYTSDYVIDETVTTALARTHDFHIALRAGAVVIDSPRIEKLFTGQDVFALGWRKFRKFGKKPMSFTDCVSLAHMEKHGIEKIMSFDSEFDGLVTRLH